MSRHQRSSSSNSTRSRIIVGSAMTAVFLSGGAGVAMADTTADNGGEPGNVIKTVTDPLNETVGGVGDVLDGILGDDTTIEQKGKNNTATVINGDGNTVTNNTTNNYGVKNERKKDDEKKRDCGCPKDKKDDDHKKDCPKDKKEPVKQEEKDDDAVKGVTTVANVDDDEEVKGASVDDSTDDDEVKGASVEDYTPVGAADTGDGSFVPSVPAVAPVAATWSTGDSMLAAGGALAAVGLLAGAGVGVGRHRRGGTHRVSA